LQLHRNPAADQAAHLVCYWLCAHQKLRRYTGLNHLAQAARAVLNNPYSLPKKVNSEHVKQMQEDYERIDFVNVQEQVGRPTSISRAPPV
jgi:hypothetical protein